MKPSSKTKVSFNDGSRPADALYGSFTTRDDCDNHVSASLVPNGPNIAYDFSAWSSFRLDSGRRSGSGGRRWPSPDPGPGGVPESDSDSDSDSDTDSDTDSYSDDAPYYGPEPEQVVVRLTEKERYDNARWLLRLQVGRVFSRNYVPSEWQAKEMRGIADFLALQDPSDFPDYLNKPQQQAARRAIGSVFFPRPGERRSVLMKRGPVLVDGEERELMLFTNGFLLCDVELDAFVSVLLDASPRRGSKLLKRRGEKQLKSRFSEIDANQSGALDRGEVKEFFISINVPLSEENLDALMDKFDENKDGQISFEEFRSMTDHLQDRQGTGSFWSGIGKAARRTLARRGVTRKLDAAFRICDIEKIKREGEGPTSISFVARLKDGGDPLEISCSKSGHVDAWLEAFRICIVNDAEGGDADDAADVGYDFSAWESFRSCMPVEKQQALRRSSQRLLGGSQREVTDGIDWGEAEEEKREININHLEAMGGTHDRDHPENEDPLQLTEEEMFENARWSMRLQVDEVFSKSYEPLPYEMKEMESILGFLKLEDPADQPEPTDDHLQQKTEKAISSIFFPRVGDLRATLLKRGPVLEGGEERELMLFTNGFLLSNVQLNDLVNVLLDASSGRILGQSEKQVERRFSSIDADDSGSLDRDEVQGLLQGLGMTVDETVLDKLMDAFDIDSDGSISLHEFKLMMQGMKSKKPTSRHGSFWGSLGEGLKGALTKQGISRKLYVAYQISDIESVETVDDDMIDPELATLTLAVRVRDVEDPLVISFSKPGHLDAWLEAFDVCVGHEAKAARIREVHQMRLARRSWQKSVLDWWDDDMDGLEE